MQKCPKTFIHDFKYFGLTKQSYTQHSCEAGQPGQNWSFIDASIKYRKQR